jgi:hypothetical protein
VRILSNFDRKRNSKFPFLLPALWGSRGYSLVELLVAVFVMGLSAAATVQIVSNYTASSSFLEKKSGRDQLLESSMRILSSPGALYLSANLGGSASADFSACVLGQSGPGACRARRSAGFELYSPEDAIKASGPIGGTGVFYNPKTGAPCTGETSPSAACPTELRTGFEAFCLDDAATCRQAITLKLSYEIIHHTNVDPVQTAALRNLSGFVLMDLQQVSLFKEQVNTNVDVNKNLGCGKNEMTMGFDGLGNVICQKINFLCPNGQTAMGIDRYGRPIANLNTPEGQGQFDNLTEVRCVASTCNNGLMVGLNDQQGNMIGSRCMTEISCDPTTSQVLTGVGAGGVPQCLALQTCSQANVGGSDYTKFNYTDSYTIYNGSIADGGVVSTCQAFGCGLNAYMGSWKANGNCEPIAAPQPPVAPVCGIAHQASRSTQPSVSELCAAGTASAVVGPSIGPWTWNCYGTNGNTSSVACETLSRLEPKCGPAHLASYSTRPIGAADLFCEKGTPSPAPPSPVNGSGPWTWKCRGTGGATDASCSTGPMPPPPPGKCNDSLKTAPATSEPPPPAERCTAGTETGFNGPTGNPMRYTWVCVGNPDDPTCYSNHTPGPVKGICGSAGQGGVVSAKPTSNLCDPTTPDAEPLVWSATPAPGRWTWNCLGKNGGEKSPECVANLDPNSLPEDGVCGTANGFSVSSAPSGSSLCAKGIPSADPALGTGPWLWTCAGKNGGASSPQCQAPVNNLCGSAHGTTVSAAPSGTNLCVDGAVATPASFSSAPYSWTCSMGDISNSCAALTNGVCNALTTSSKHPSGSVFSSAQKCEVGVASAASPQEGGDGPWNWTCNGYNGGSSPTCTALMLNSPVGKWCQTLTSEPQCASPIISDTSKECAIGDIGWVSRCPGLLESDRYTCIDSKDTCPAPPPPPSKCRVQDVVWEDAGNRCSANISETSRGSTVMVQDSTAPLTGAAAFTCGTDGAWQGPNQNPAPTCKVSETCNCSGDVYANADCSGTVNRGSAFESRACQSGCDGNGTYWTCPAPPPSCPSQTVNWTVSSASCSATLPLTEANTDATATDSTPSSTGTAVFTCSAGGSWLTSPKSGATCTGCNKMTLVSPEIPRYSIDGDMLFPDASSMSFFPGNCCVAEFMGGAEAYSKASGSEGKLMYCDMGRPGGQCGAARGVGSPTKPTNNLCSVGDPTIILDRGGVWTWACQTFGGPPVECDAPKIAKTFASCKAGVSFDMGEGGFVCQSNSTVPHGTFFADCDQANQCFLCYDGILQGPQDCSPGP